MSEPDAMRSRGSASLALRVLLVVGFVIAAGATVLVILAKDVQLLRLAAVLALWAALIAAFAVFYLVQTVQFWHTGVPPTQ